MQEKCCIGSKGPGKEEFGNVVYGKVVTMKMATYTKQVIHPINGINNKQTIK